MITSFSLSSCRYLIASHTTDYQNPMLFFNTLAVLILVGSQVPKHAQGPYIWDKCRSLIEKEMISPFISFAS